MATTIDEKIFEKPKCDDGKVDEVLTEERIEALKNFADSIGVQFTNFATLNRALTHKSYAKEFEPQLNDNQRLEFLGDAVLGLASATYFFEHFKSFKESALTRLRSSVVRQSTLTRLAEEIHLDDVLLLGFTERTSVRGRDSNLEDAFEALIGAIYLDCGWEIARDFVLQQLAPEFERVKVTGIPKDYKSKLQEIIQRDPTRTVAYAEINMSGPPHMRTFESAALIDGRILGRGVGKSKKLAEQEAAKEALQNLGELGENIQPE